MSALVTRHSSLATSAYVKEQTGEYSDPPHEDFSVCGCQDIVRHYPYFEVLFLTPQIDQRHEKVVFGLVKGPNPTLFSASIGKIAFS